MYASWRPQYSGGGDYPVGAFLEDLQTGKRHRVMSGGVATRWDTWWTQADQGYLQLSTDGKVVASMPEGQGGVYFCRDGATPTAHHPAIKSVRQRYDGDYLVITVEATAPDKMGRVQLLPMKNSLLPNWVVKGEQNPLAWMDYRRAMVPVEKRPGVYEARVYVGSLDAYIDPSYSFRVVAVNAEETRSTYQDYPVLR